MSPRFSHLWMPAVAVALLSGSVLACPPGQKKGTSAQLDVNSDSVKSGTTKSDTVKSKTSKFRNMVLDQFDTNQNGRLDSKERAAANRALSGKGGGPAIEALRKQALAEFDANGNGKLDKTEIHKALSSVNASSTDSQVAANALHCLGKGPDAFPHHGQMQAFADVKGIAVLSDELPSNSR